MTNAAVRRLDHVTVLSRELFADSDVFCKVLGFRYMDGTRLMDGPEIFQTITSGAQNHDHAIAAELPGYDGPGGRLHHVCWYYDTIGEWLRAFDVLAEHGLLLEAGPNKHGIGELYFAYFFEPGGNRIELQTGGYWNYLPDWEPVIWTIEQGGNLAWHKKQVIEPASPLPPTAAERQESAFNLASEAQAVRATVS